MKTNNDYHNELLKNLPESYKIWFEEEKKYLAKVITPDSRVLEIGCGDGRSISDILSVTENITGVDHDKNAIKEAKERFNTYPSIKILEADAVHVPLPDQSFDFVICMACFGNFGETKLEILKEMKRVLKNSGKIIISVFSQNAFPKRMKVYQSLGAKIKEINQGTVIFDESLGDNISEQFTKHELKTIFDTAHLTIGDITEVNMAYICTLTK